jgi:hypothetical protein
MHHTKDEQGIRHTFRQTISVQVVIAEFALAALLAGCGATPVAGTSNPPSARTPIPSATPALTPPVDCGNAFDQYDQEVKQPTPTYVQYDDPPNGSYPGIAYPPFTRAMPDDAAGIEGIDLCSVGTGASILAFMTNQFNNAG